MSHLSFEQLKNYENKWVAFAGPDRHEIVGSGATLTEAKHQALLNGVRKPLFFRVMSDAYYIPLL